MSLADKVALITGASKGIGKATALLLAKQGAKVAINYSSDAAAADELVDIIGKDRAFAIKGNAGSIFDIEKMVKETVDRFGKIDILIPNAGILPMKDLEHTTEEDFDNAFGVNVKGPYFLVQVGFQALPVAPLDNWIVKLTETLESCPTYATGISHHPSFHHPEYCLLSLSALPALLLH